MKEKMLLIKKSLKSKRRYRLVVRLKAIEYKEDFLNYLFSYCQSSFQAFLSLLSQDMSFYKSFIFFFVISLVFWSFWSRYNRAHCCDGYLIGSSARISSVNTLLTRLSSSYALDFLLLGFITKTTCIDNYFAITLAHQVVW